MTAIDTSNGALVPPSQTLDAEATVVLARLRDGLAAVIAAQSGGEVRKAADLHKVLKLDRALAWSLYRVATASHPLDAGPYVPGNAPMKRFLQTAQQAGTPDHLIESVRGAFEDFEGMVERHAGDREAFESMIVHSDTSRREAADLKHKREAFRSNGHLWGVQSRAVLITSIVHPGASPGTFDIAMIRGHVGLRQLRPETPTHTSIRWKNLKDGDTPDHAERPIEPSGVVSGGVSLLQEFCSKPLPRFRTIPDQDGYTRAELLSEGVGNSAAINFFMGTVIRNGHSPFPNKDSLVGFVNRVRRPTEAFLLDVFVHRSLWSGPGPLVRICSGDGGGTEGTASWDAESLPIQERITEIDRGIDAVHTQDVPRYREMIEHAAGCLKWNPREFRIFRCRIEYPIIHSVVRIHFPRA